MNDVSSVYERASVSASSLWFSRIALGVGAVLSLLFVLAVVQPPGPPAVLGLDASWRIALTEATLRHLRFGHDIVYTFGPLGYVLSGTPAVQLAVPTAYLSLGLAIVALLGLWTVSWGRAGMLQRGALFVAFVVAVATGSIDLVVFLGVLMLLARAARFPRLAPFVAIIVALAGTFGLLSKQTLGLDVFASAGVMWLFYAVRGPRRMRRAALISIALAAVVATASLLGAFGSAANALEYVVKSAQVVAGYSSAMSLPGPKPVFFGAIAIFALTAAAAIALAREGKGSFAAAALVSLFLAWKHGFVRADGHVITFFLIAGVTAPLIAILARRQQTLIVSGIATIAAMCGVLWTALTFGTDVVALVSPQRLALGAGMLTNPVATVRAQETISEEKLRAESLPPAAIRAIGSRTTDVLPMETEIVFVNGLHWRPLPVFQLYVAYTSQLDLLDRDALAARGADVILFRDDEIDGRYPFASAPATSAELLCRYHLAPWKASTKIIGPLITLERSPANRCREEDAGSTASMPVPSPVIPVPTIDRPGTFVRAAFDIRLTPLGWLTAALWRPPLPWLETTLRDGTVRRSRLVQATARDGIVISPMPHDSIDPAGPPQRDAAALFAGDALPANEVTGVRILAPGYFYRIDGVRFTRVRR